MIVEQYMDKPLKQLFDDHPYAKNWLAQICSLKNPHHSLHELFFKQEESFYFTRDTNPRRLIAEFDDYLKAMKERLKQPMQEVQRITLFPGRNKSGESEKFDPLSFYPGEIIAIVGPTGSGKSRLLEDIEGGAGGNTPTGRRVMINGEVSYIKEKRKAGQRIVAQLSQNMNFLVDLTVGGFLRMHARCWPSTDNGVKVERILKLANSLSGEKFEMGSNVAQLSGGQSRALMIADCALLSPAPIILIDEIENAGINRRKALELLTSEDKIVFLATHDPLLALLAQRRLVIENGGICRIIFRNKGEEETLKKLELWDRQIAVVRGRMRAGEMMTCCELQLPWSRQR